MHLLEKEFQSGHNHHGPLPRDILCTSTVLNWDRVYRNDATKHREKTKVEVEDVHASVGVRRIVKGGANEMQGRHTRAKSCECQASRTA